MEAQQEVKVEAKQEAKVEAEHKSPDQKVEVAKAEVQQLAAESLAEK